MEVFKDYTYYYNIFYWDKDYREESLQVDNLLKRYGNDISKIINYGCGTGRHDFELSQIGYQCTGIDMSSLMIEMARKNVSDMGVNIDFEVADIRSYKPHKKYDAVISLFHVISYQNSNQDVLETFQAARRALDKGGIFLFDVWYGPGVLSDKPVVRVKEIEDAQNRFVRIARPIMHNKENIVDVCYEVFVIDKTTGNEKQLMRYIICAISFVLS